MPVFVAAVFDMKVSGDWFVCLMVLCWNGGRCGLPASLSWEKMACLFAGLFCSFCMSWIFYLHKCVCSASSYTINLSSLFLWQSTIITKTGLKFGRLSSLGHCSIQFYRFIKFYREHVFFLCLSTVSGLISLHYVSVCNILFSWIYVLLVLNPL